MSPYRAVLLALFAVGGVLVAAPAGATVDADSSVADTGGGADRHAPDAAYTGPPSAVAANNSTGNSSLGADISSFMQSSTAEVGGAVETGMWTAAFDATSNRSTQVALVERRTAELRSELADLERRKARLVADREAGNVSETAYKAKVSLLVGRIHALESAIHATSARAERVNAEVEALESLRTETRNLTGPAIAAIARNLTGVGAGKRGPPADVRTSVGGADGATDATAEPSNGAGASNGNGASDTGGPSNEDRPSNVTTGTPTAVGATPPTDATSHFGVTPPRDLVEGVGSAVDAATAAFDRAASAIPV